MFGPTAAAAVPSAGLSDVHRYLTMRYRRQVIAIDVTFPAMPRWDGTGSMTLACGPGDVLPAGPDPDAAKRALEAAHCDAVIRERFIAALSAGSRGCAGGG